MDKFNNKTIINTTLFSIMTIGMIATIVPSSVFVQTTTGSSSDYRKSHSIVIDRYGNTKRSTGANAHEEDIER